MFYSFY